MPTSVEGLLVITLVLAPGFVFTLVVTKTVERISAASEIRFILTILTMGVVIHGILFPWSIQMLNRYIRGELLDARLSLFGWGVTTIFAVPVLLGLVVGWASRRESVDKLLGYAGFGYVDRLRSAWEYVLLPSRSAYVRVHLKDGKGVVGGAYGPESFASTDPRDGDLYLQELWLLDENLNFVQPIARSRGAWISRQVMDYVEFLEGEDKPYVAGENSSGTGEDTTDRRLAGS